MDEEEQSARRANPRIAEVTLDEGSVVKWSAQVEHERKVAIFDLLEQNYFAPDVEVDGPYTLNLSIQDNRLILDIGDEAAKPLTKISLPVTPFRGIVRDYFMICESYYDAIKKSSPSQIEALDMGRRAVHNEGSELLRERLESKVEIDMETARRLFTLLCVLHIRQ